MYMSHTIQLVIKIRGQESRKERGEGEKHCSHTWNGEFHIINLVKNEHHTTPGILTQSKINKKMRLRFGKVSYPPILKLTVCKVYIIVLPIQVFCTYCLGKLSKRF